MPAARDSDARNSAVLRENPTLIVGAGAQGLTFGLSLARRGRPVVLIEGSGAVGGQARSFRYGGFTFDFGLHAFISRNDRVLRLAAALLGDEFSSFRARAATRLDTGALVEDSSRWRHGGARCPLYDLLPGPGDGGWNCMAVDRPPRVVYPRSGGFGRLLERMADAFVASGGCLLLETRLAFGDLRISCGRLSSVVIRRRRVPVAGCYWTAGSYFRARAEGGERDGPALALYHVRMRGRPRVPYHWVRLDGSRHPLRPRLVYFPARFSARNAPAGHHGIGAVVPLPGVARVPARLKPLVRWCRERPEDFAAPVQSQLARAGLLREADVIDVRTELLPLPPSRPRHAHPSASNIWDAKRWTADDPAESGVPQQMASAMNAADELLARAGF